MATSFGIAKATLVHMFILSLLLVCFGASFVKGLAGHLPHNEINALREIAEQVGKKDWDFSLNPCDGNSNWTTPKRNDMPLYNNTVNCSCSYPGGVCHITWLFLKGQDLAGVIPPSVVKLPNLTNIDLSRNYLNGTIPPEWASTKLEYISVMGNRLSGRIPKYLGNITTLIYVSLENNMFTGTVPAELGKLVNLVNLILGANNLTGELPVELNNLVNLTELRLSSNNFTGKFPDLKSFTNLQKLELQASGFEGPISPSISVLNNLTELRISDLNGGASNFPLLKNMRDMKRLMLRSCNISGQIPDDIADMASLQILDLSFNNLHGKIPNLEGLQKLEYMYLTHNSYTGPIPDWIKGVNSKLQIDLSYNKFSENSVPSTCGETLNLFRSFSETKKSNFGELGKCLASFPCSKDRYSLHINCGGERVKIGDTVFEADVDLENSVKFVPVSETWGISSTGHFWDRNSTLKDYIAQNRSILNVNDSELYTRARLSPLSLTYYGRCLANGYYNVTLHFAEIIFRGNQSYQSLGRRLFNVYIQDELKLKDFDIAHVAQGVDKAVTQNFTVLVKDKTLQVRFLWAGKGTTAIPSRGTYGPLVSAISIESEFKPPDHGKKKVTIAVVPVVSTLCLIFVVIGIAWWKGYLGGRTSISEDLIGLEIQTGLFTFRQIKAATNNFDDANKIGEGGFGSVYKGTLLDGTIIAVKKLSSKSKQGNREFVNEIGMISGLQHPNLVKLYGCCVEGNQLLLVYEYMENNSLAHALFRSEERQLNLDWPTRQRICVGVAKGLAFLHEESGLKIVHRDIKATNILLDRNLEPKISDFGLARLDDEENTHISTRVAGTIGYMAPEYALWGYLTYKADVYSFGVVALEIVAGKNSMKYRPNDNYVCLLDWALVLQRKDSLIELVDPMLGSNFNEEEAERMIKVALLCTNPSPALRPTMSAVVGMLEGHISVQELNLDPSIYGDELKLQALRDKYDELDLQNLAETVSLVHSSSVVHNASSSSSV